MARQAYGRASGDENASEIDLTPMLDVVFIMLIFFIVTASFIKEAGIEVNRPEASTAQKKENVNILVAISGTNEIWIDQRRVDERSVRSVIERLHAENPKGAIVIQADRNSNTKTVTAVMDAARAAGVFDVSLATEEG
ncbi:MAG TPA: biopolymer transporter ExbD [Spongiibacteraceae bacterium]|jgi:biopolymer transport protein ExbD|nr:biopolymer transporter ExbD [Spongiibacteraceae bacterium]HUH36968.1 biopolymer transporter ExbD [Spongiibacteraceae bacterium]